MITAVIYVVACSTSLLYCVDLSGNNDRFENMQQCLDQRPAIILKYEKEWEDSPYPVVMAKCRYILSK